MSSADELQADARYALSARECAAARLLARDGWSTGVLKMTLQISRDGVRNHVTGGCDHGHGVPAIPDWDGETPPARASSDERYGSYADD
jgi:hypothetical protein